LTENPGA